MKIALSVWKDCISTVFDSADQMLIVETDSKNKITKTPVKFVSVDPAARSAQLKNQGVDILICGAVSRPVLALIRSQGITVHSFIRGEIDAIITAYQNNQLGQAVFSLPGCRRRLIRDESEGHRRVRCRWRHTT